ncbi:MAG: hypothetical protein V4463_19735 [Pseudomonadota bacterium]
MDNQKIRWLRYTVMVGLIPLAMRLLVWSVTPDGIVDPFAPQDFISFGLILHISIINELEHTERVASAWRTLHNGVAVFSVVLYSALSGVGLLRSDAIDLTLLRNVAAGLALVSFSFAYLTYGRVFQNG